MCVWCGLGIPFEWVVSVGGYGGVQVGFEGDIDWMDCLPGIIIDKQSHYVNLDQVIDQGCNTRVSNSLYKYAAAMLSTQHLPISRRYPFYNPPTHTPTNPPHNRLQSQTIQRTNQKEKLLYYTDSIEF